MTKRIVPGFLISETCPAPECNLSEHDVEQFVGELETYFELLAPAFHRRDQFAWGEVYLKGLLGDAQRKTSERIALDSNPLIGPLQTTVPVA